MRATPPPQPRSVVAIVRAVSRQACAASHAADHADRWAIEITRLAEEYPAAGLGVIVPVALRAAELAERCAILAAGARRQALDLAEDQGDFTRSEWVSRLREHLRVAWRAARSAEEAAVEAASAVRSVSPAA